MQRRCSDACRLKLTELVHSLDQECSLVPMTKVPILDLYCGLESASHKWDQEIPIELESDA